MTRQIEQAVLLGPRASLVGVLTRGGGAPSQRVAVILNAGIIHRAGPNRLTVQLARDIAADGLDVLRFDLSGIGDSAPRRDEMLPLDAAMADIREVFETLEKQWHKHEFVLVGLCSGADHSVVFAGGDPRVIGMVLLDPTMPHTPQYHLRFYLWKLHGLLEIKRLQRLASRIAAYVKGVSSIRKSDASEPMPNPQGLDLDSSAIRESTQRVYSAALKDGRRMLAIFSDGLPSQHNYERQLVDALPGVNFGSQYQSAYIHGADHVFTDEVHRDRVKSIVRRWIKSLPFRDPA